MTVKSKNEIKSASTFAKEEDGSIQITFNIPFSRVKEAQDKSLSELSKEIEVPGFRKGNAPLDKVRGKVPENILIERALSLILPKLFSGAIVEHKFRPAIYPKFELISAKDGEDWQVRAITAELSEVELGDYKKVISGVAKTEAIWTPGKDTKEKKELTKEDKERLVIKTLLEITKIKIPRVLIEEEVNSRLSQLLARIEKLGLSLESYLSSLGKKPDELRKEYEGEAKGALTLDLALSKIASEEKITVSDAEVDKAIEARHTHPVAEKHEHSSEEKRLVRAVLLRGRALDSLTKLVQ